MGTVYRAWDAHAGGPVAVKLLHRHGVEDAERFAREAGVLAQLSHPGIVRYVAHGTAPDGECYLVTEWLQGPTLRHRVRQGPLSVPATLALGRQVSDALTEAHQHGVVHRDIKPSNLVLVDDAVERVKVIDFGVARRLRDNRDLTLAGVMVGTPGYVSPEQARGDRRIDARSDVFSLGCVLFECLTGHAAFVGQNVTAAAVKVLLEEEPPLRQLREGVPESLETLVERMLNKDPDDRPADAAAVASALRRIEDAGMLGPTKTGRTRRRRTSSPDVRRTGLTGDEQRVLCLVMASAPLETPLPFDEAKFLHELSQSLDKFGVQLQPVADGALLATLQGRGARWR